MTGLDNKWFTEEWPGEKSAISLRLRKKLHEEQSRYQRIEIFETETFGKLMTLDGLVMVTDRDNFIYHEMLTHPALFSHPAPARVLIIGGGDCGTLREVLRHREVQHVDMVEIDERVTRVAEQFFPDLCESNNDPRAHLHFTDGIAWLRECGTGQYDVIIVDGTDPEGPGATLFSKAFYDCCASALKTNGILVGQTESPLFHMDLIRTVHQTLRQSGFKATRTLHFPQCTYPSGWWSVTMAGADLDTTPRPAQGMNTRYYTPQIHQAAAVLPAFMTSELD